ncbi:hypothetical protein VaNZ11_005400 [Volvox africanus]|uniref:Uncharacterized protein n=1 Tax=Volvox africanus TaxID=51714 RepID=A0ABQ5RYY7_9CHLO|nr:hypothetical protein VaNZ11_005400 [Volvox africanus]
MELSLLQLAITHFLAAKAGSWVTARGRHRQDSKPQTCSSDLARKRQKIQSLKPMNCSRQRRDKKLAETSEVHRKNASQGCYDHGSNLTALSSSSISARGQTVHKHRACLGVVPTAWMLAGHSSADTMLTRSPWAKSSRSEEVKPRQQSMRAAELDGGIGQPPSSENVAVNMDPAGGLIRWCVPRHLQHRSGELLEGWHLDDEPMPLQYDKPLNVPSTSIAAAFSAAVSRLFGGGDNSGCNGGAGDSRTRTPHEADSHSFVDAGDAAQQPSPRGSTPHLVGYNALGAMNAKNAGAGSSSSVNSGVGIGVGMGSSSSTASVAAAALTSASGALGNLAERAVEVPVRGLRELNRAVTAGVSDFLASDSGRRLSEQMAAEMSTGALMAPVYLTEELVKARLKSLLRSHARWLATYFAVRVSLTTAVLHCGKELLRSSVRKRGPRWLRGCVHFICDVMLPTGFFGPLLGVTIGVLQTTGLGLGGLIWRRRGGGSSAGTSGAGGSVRNCRGGAAGRVRAAESSSSSDPGRGALLPVVVEPVPLSLLLLPSLQQLQLQQGQGAVRTCGVSGAPVRLTLPTSAGGRGVKTGLGNAGESVREVTFTADVWS